MKISVDFNGMDNLKGVLKEKAELDDVKNAVRLNGSEMQRKAKRKAPKDTRHLARNINLEIEDDGLTAKVEPAVFYAGYLEYGTGIYAENGSGRKTPWVYYSDQAGHFVTTVGMEPQPFLRPSFHAQKAQFERDLRRLVD